MITSDKPNLTLDVNDHQQVDIHNGKLLGKTTIRGNATMDKLQLKLDGKLQPLEKYSRMKAYHTLQQANITTHKHHKKWDTFFEGEAIHWPSLNTHPTNNPNLINIRFLMMHGAIRIGTQARHWLKDTDLSCPSCKQECNDIHLFLECPTTKHAWKHVEMIWKSLQQRHPILEPYQIKESWKLFGPPNITAKNIQEKRIYATLDILIGHMQSIIWKSYNEKIFDDKQYTATSIIETYKSNIKKSLNCLNYARRQKAYHASRWIAQKTPIDESEQEDGPPWEKILIKIMNTNHEDHDTDENRNYKDKLR